MIQAEAKPCPDEEAKARGIDEKGEGDCYIHRRQALPLVQIS